MGFVQVDNNLLPAYDVEVVDGSTASSKVQVFTSGFAVPKYDYLAVTYPIATQEVYVFKLGGSGGTTVATITLNYTDATKASLSSAERS